MSTSNYNLESPQIILLALLLSFLYEEFVLGPELGYYLHNFLHRNPKLIFIYLIKDIEAI